MFFIRSKMKILLFFIVILLVNGVLAQIRTCNNIDDSCNRLNALLAPCYYQIDFTLPFFYNSIGVGKYKEKL